MKKHELNELKACIDRSFEVVKNAEISLEFNPGTVDTEYLACLVECGVNRLSIGFQSLDDDELRLLGRLHNRSDAERAVYLARAAGFDNINLDLIYGLPGQTVQTWIETLEAAVDLGPRHLSLYGLSLDPETPLAGRIDSGELPSIDLDTAAEQYEMAEYMLDKYGYRHYELSNWAKPGYECRHNLSCWLMEPYLGVGLAASSYLEDRRRTNTSSLKDYIECSVASEFDEEISGMLKQAETVILALRLDSGIDLDRFEAEFGADFNTLYNAQLEELEGLGMVRRTGNSIVLTPKGRLLGNEVFWRFLPD